MRSSRVALAALLALLSARATAQVADRPVTEGAPGGGRFSPLTDITRENVTQLQIAWTYRHGDFWEGSFPVPEMSGSVFEATPIVVDRRLFFTTPANRVIALDPETGRELWTFDPKLERGGIYRNMWINRGVAYWRDPAATGACAARVFLATLDARLIALDAVSGVPCAEFGAGGTVNLLDGIAPLYDVREYNVTSPGTVAGDTIVVGSSIPDLVRPDSPPGDVRGFDVRTGALRWTFHTIPHAGEVGYETWETGTALTGAANVWSTITADLARGWVFLPVSTPTPDFYGGDRAGANWFSDSVVARDAQTGRRIWHFQTVHHRSLGLRPRRAAGAGHDHARGPARPRRRAGDETRLRVRARPRDGRAAVPGRGEAGARERRSRRTRLADAAGADRAAAARAPATERERSLRADARAPRRLPRATGGAAQRRPIHAAEPARIGDLPVHGRRRELVRRELRSRAPTIGRAGPELRAHREAGRGRRARDRRRHARAAVARHEAIQSVLVADRPRDGRSLPRALARRTDAARVRRRAVQSAAVGLAGRGRSRARHDRMERIDEHRRR